LEDGHISLYTTLIWLQIGTTTRHLNTQLNLHVPYKAETLSLQERLCQMAFMHRFSKRIHEMGSHCKQGSTKKLNSK